jgi:hypothetical protein
VPAAITARGSATATTLVSIRRLDQRIACHSLIEKDDFGDGTTDEARKGGWCGVRDKRKLRRSACMTRAFRENQILNLIRV